MVSRLAGGFFAARLVLPRRAGRVPFKRLHPIAGARAAALRVIVGAVASSLGGGSPSRGAHGAAFCGAALALLAPAHSCRRGRGGVALSRRSSAVAARSLGAVRSAQRLALSACGRWRGRFLSGGGRCRPPTSQSTKLKYQTRQRTKAKYQTKQKQHRNLSLLFEKQKARNEKSY